MGEMKLFKQKFADCPPVEVVLWWIGHVIRRPSTAASGVRSTMNSCRKDALLTSSSSYSEEPTTRRHASATAALCRLPTLPFDAELADMTARPVLDFAAIRGYMFVYSQSHLLTFTDV